MASKTSQDRIREMRNLKGWSQEKLAEMIVPPTSKMQIYQLESGKRKLNLDWLERIAAALGCQPADLLPEAAAPAALNEPPATLYAPMPAVAPDAQASQHININVYDVQVSAGNGAWHEGDAFIVDQLSFRLDWLRNKTKAPLNKLAVVKVNGDSMEPTLSDGDTVLVDMTQTHPISGKLYVVWDEGALYVKRIQVQGGATSLLSDNPQYSPYALSSGNTQIVGRVIWQGRSW